jgi:hypothetical protein
MNKFIFKKIIFLKKQSGFAMLFTVLIVSLILSIAIGISNITLKQTMLSSLAKDSQIAFYQADAAVECGMYYDMLGSFPQGTTPGSVAPINCGDNQFSIDVSESYNDRLVFTQNLADQSQPCAVIIFDKTNLDISGESLVQGIGYNICGTNSRQVERALEVRY